DAPPVSTATGDSASLGSRQVCPNNVLGPIRKPGPSPRRKKRGDRAGGGQLTGERRPPGETGAHPTDALASDEAAAAPCVGDPEAERETRMALQRKSRGALVVRQRKLGSRSRTRPGY